MSDRDPPEGESSSVRAPRQARSRRTLERLTAAAVELLAEGGAEAIAVARVVERAGASVGSFYARFRTKDDLLRYLEAHLREAAWERWRLGYGRLASAELPVRELVQGLVSLLVRLYRADLRLLAELGGRGGTRAGEDLHSLLLRDVRDLLLRHRGEIAHPDPAGAVGLGYWMLMGTLREVTQREVVVAGAEADERLAVELSRALLAYLTGGVGGHASGGDPADFFDPWG